MRDFAPFPDGRGDPYRPSGARRLRIGDAERDAATADLGEHYAAGRLTLDELHQRVDAVLAAKTFGQLAALMEDLPGPGRLRWTAEHPYWHGARSGFPQTGFQRAGSRQAGHSGRFAALALLLLAMLIWLFTALLFVRHGVYHGVNPPGPPHHIGYMFPGPHG